jgi:hypothetical protein
MTRQEEDRPHARGKTVVRRYEERTALEPMYAWKNRDGELYQSGRRRITRVRVEKPFYGPEPLEPLSP